MNLLDHKGTRLNEIKREYSDISKRISIEQIDEIQKEFNMTKTEAILFLSYLEIKDLSIYTEEICNNVFDVKTHTEFIQEVMADE